MDAEVAAKIEPILDEIADTLEELLSHDVASRLRSSLEQLMAEHETPYSVLLDCRLEVGMENSGDFKSIPLIQSGLSVGPKGCCVCWGDSTPHRYVADGKISVVPHDRCPRCWELWDNKE